MYISQLIVLGSVGFVFTVNEKYIGNGKVVKEIEREKDNIHLVRYLDGSQTKVISDNVIIHFNKRQ